MRLTPMSSWGMKVSLMGYKSPSLGMKVSLGMYGMYVFLYLLVM